MNGDDESDLEEEEFLALMAGCDELLAAGHTSDFLGAAAPSQQPRLIRNIDVIRLVRQILGRPADTTSPATDPTT
jgi:hypothetical protein